MYDVAEGWADNPPFHAPIFVLTHTPREPIAKDGGRRKRDPAVPRPGLIDEMQVHVAPPLLD